MPTELLMTIITEIVGLIGIVLTFVVSNKKLKNEQAQRMDEHNDVIMKQISESQKNTQEEMNRIQGYFSNHAAEVQKALSDIRTSQEVVEVKLAQLEKKQDKHNEVIERVYKLESQMSVLQKEA